MKHSLPFILFDGIPGVHYVAANFYIYWPYVIHAPLL